MRSIIVQSSALVAAFRSSGRWLEDARRAIPVVALLAVLAPSLTGQVAPAAARPESAKDGETVFMSPFEVKTDSDVGYIATNSLAGSRLNSALKDTPAIIDVFTTKWWHNGSTTVATTSTTALTVDQTALGFTRPLTASRVVYVENQGYVMDVRNAWATAQDLPYAANLINDSARVPYAANPVGPGGRAFHDFDNITAVVEHRFSRHLAGEVGYYHEAGDWTNYDVGTSDNVPMLGDPNGLLRNSTTVQGLTGVNTRPSLGHPGASSGASRPSDRCADGLVESQKRTEQAPGNGPVCDSPAIILPRTLSA